MKPWASQATPPSSESDPLDELVGVSRLLGSQRDLVLHGGGNTSCKGSVQDVFGKEHDALFVKGSGINLATIDASGFAVTDLEMVRRLLSLDELSDFQMVNELRRSLLDVSGPNPSLETILHAFLPHPFVIHTHADAFLTVSDTADGDAILRELFGDTAVLADYRRPGLPLALACVEAWEAQANEQTTVLFLKHHGVFTFGDSAEEAYGRMFDVVGTLEARIASASSSPSPASSSSPANELTDPDPVQLARFRAEVSDAAGQAMIMTRVVDPTVAGFVSRPDLESLTEQGPATPDHVIRTKSRPQVGRDVAGFVADYKDYFDTHSARQGTDLVMLDPAPRVVLDSDWGLLGIGESYAAAKISSDIYRQTIDCVNGAEALGGFRPLGVESQFEIEYWALEQAKLTLAEPSRGLTGQIAIVTGAASGIGRACAQALLDDGAAVCGIDLSADVATTFEHPTWLGVQANVTDREQMRSAIAQTVERFGGIDIVVIAAGIFGQSAPIADLPVEDWRKVLSINVDSVFEFFQDVHPVLAASPVSASVVMIASKNVPAPGKGAAAYSTSKAALVQLSRVAALEWADDGIRINMVHPDAVFDTGLWTPELLAERAEKYGLSIDEYKRRNLLSTEVKAASVGALGLDMCGPGFVATTGSQVPIDGGSDRVI